MLLAGKEMINWPSQDPAKFLSQIVLRSTTISNRHLRIYSVIYDQTIEPFVYAEDLSRNGSRWLFKKLANWKSYPMGNSASFLLSNGDRLQLCDGTLLTFHAAPFRQDVQQLEDSLTLQTVERKVLGFLTVYRG